MFLFSPVTSGLQLVLVVTGHSVMGGGESIEGVVIKDLSDSKLLTMAVNW